MMLDFVPVKNKEMSLHQLTSKLTQDDLARLTNEMIDAILGQIVNCVDADVTFVPNDPEAKDPFAASEDELRIAWTLGHVIVHITASSEESAAIASELARGVPFRGGRSRWEVPWRTVTTIAQCRHRLEESRRMRLASLEMWPDHPDLENSYQPSPEYESRNAIIRFVLGLQHDDSHLGQIAEIVRQTKDEVRRMRDE
jgi:hypothetical protein